MYVSNVGHYKCLKDMNCIKVCTCMHVWYGTYGIEYNSNISVYICMWNKYELVISTRVYIGYSWQINVWSWYM